MIRIITVLAILLWSAVALASDGTTPPDELVSLIFASWGQWSIVGGVAMLLAIQAWRRAKPHVWGSLHPAVKRLLPPTVSALTTAAVGLTAGGTWAEFAQVFLGQLLALYVGVEAMGGGGAVIDSILDSRQKAIARRVVIHAVEKAVAEANAKSPGKPPVTDDELPPAA
jgi:hypothetical protein